MNSFQKLSKEQLAARINQAAKVLQKKKQFKKLEAAMDNVYQSRNKLIDTVNKGLEQADYGLMFGSTSVNNGIRKVKKLLAASSIIGNTPENKTSFFNINTALHYMANGKKVRRHAWHVHDESDAYLIASVKTANTGHQYIQLYIYDGHTCFMELPEHETTANDWELME